MAVAVAEQRELEAEGTARLLAEAAEVGAGCGQAAAEAASVWPVQAEALHAASEEAALSQQGQAAEEDDAVGL